MEPPPDYRLSRLALALKTRLRSREPGRDKAKRLRKRSVHTVHEHFEAVLTVGRPTTHSRS